ncbi:38173_t:CDS:2, partial [Gigaspora margarita]
MDIMKEFEVAQEIYAEKLSKQDEEVAQKIEGTKKIKRKHTTKGQNKMESEQNKEDTQAIGVGTEDHQTPDLSLADNVQLMEIDLQVEQRIAERLEEELRKNVHEQVLKDKEVQKVSYSAVAKGPTKEQAPKEKEKQKLSYSEVTRGKKEEKISKEKKRAKEANSELKTEEFDGRKWTKDKILTATAVEKIRLEVRGKLPTEWNEIPLKIRKGLPCELPITDQKWIGV